MDLEIPLADFEAVYKAIIQAIAATVRYGYIPKTTTAAEQIGTLTSPLVNVETHRRFINRLFKGCANLEARSKVGFITTNYDTLLEDALAMEQRVALDGFSGGAIAFWNGLNIDPDHTNSARMHRVLKLHGSVDWFQSASNNLLRVRYGTKYLADLSSTLIYPQSTKYIETQKDPFARIFDCFRRSLRTPENHLLGIVGYSFGDSHINSEIENALHDRSNKTVVVAFSKENTDSAGNSAPCQTLQSWLNDPEFGSRIYVATDRGLYNGKSSATPTPSMSLNWWTFDGVVNFIENGIAA